MKLEVISLLFFVQCAIAQDLDEKQVQKNAVEIQIEEQKRKFDRLMGKEGSLLQELDRYSRKVSALDAEIARLDSDRSALEKESNNTLSEIGTLGSRIRELQESVLTRVRMLYMWGRPDFIHVLFTSRSILDFRKRYWILRRWIQEDQHQIENYKGLVEKLGVKRLDLETHKNGRDRLFSALSSRRMELASHKRARGDLLTLVQSQREYYRKSLEELARARHALEEMMEGLPQTPVGGDSIFTQMRGKLPLPVQGRLSRAFGPYRDQFNSRLYNKGVDLRAPKGAGVSVVFDGRVVFSGWFVGYGNIVIIDHGGGYFTLYAHLENISKRVGDLVSAGDSIATVGDSGSLKGAYLYFELREKGISQDPWPWFAAAQTLKK